MTLLAPQAALVAGVIAGAVLAVVYALRLRRRPVRVSAVWFWERAQRDADANVPLRWIRPTWLVAMQAAGLGLLVVALGRPVRTGVGVGGSRVAVVMDVSASMGARDMPGGGRRMERARERARSIIDAAVGQAGARVMVVAVAARAQQVTPWLSDRAALAAAVDRLEWTDQPLDGSALAGAVEGALGASGDESGRVSVVVIGDDVPDVPGADRVEVVGPGTPGANVGIVGLSAARGFEDPGQVRVLVRLINTSPLEKVVPMRVSVDGEVVDRRAVRVGPAGAEGVGRGSESVSLRRLGGGVLTVALEGGDALAADDAAALVLEGAGLPGILLVVPDGEALPEAGGVAGRAWMIADVLGELRAARVRTVHAGTYRDLASRGGLEPYGVLVLWGVDPVPGESRPTIELEWSEGDAGEGLVRVLWWDREHPVLRDVSLDRLVVPAGARVELGEGAADLARTRSGVVIGAQEAGGVRRVVVGFDPARVGWPLDPGFAVFTAQAVEWVAVRPRGSAGRMWRTGEVVSVPIGGGEERVRVEGPAALEAPVTPDGRAVLGHVPRVGVYRVGQAGVPVAVNLLDERESSLAVRTGRASAGSGGGAEGARGPGELWWWFALAGGVVLLAEWAINAARTRV